MINVDWLLVLLETGDTGQEVEGRDLDSQPLCSLPLTLNCLGPKPEMSSALLIACPGWRSERLTMFMGTGSYSGSLLSSFSFNTGEKNIYGCSFLETTWYDVLLAQEGVPETVVQTPE